MRVGQASQHPQYLVSIILFILVDIAIQTQYLMSTYATAAPCTGRIFTDDTRTHEIMRAALSIVERERYSGEASMHISQANITTNPNLSCHHYSTNARDNHR